MTPSRGATSRASSSFAFLPSCMRGLRSRRRLRARASIRWPRKHCKNEWLRETDGQPGLRSDSLRSPHNSALCALARCTANEV